MGRMANCYAGSLQRACPDAAVIATMRTGKTLPWLFRRSLRRVRHIISNSAEARATLVSAHGLAPEKITVIYNSLVFPATPTDPARNAALRATHRAGPATTVLLNVAMFRAEKNQRELIALAATLPGELDWQLWLAGDGPERPACERLVAELKLGARVRFLSFQADPAPLYAAADVAIHASTSESLSNFLIEAQAHGLPAVAYAAQGIPECFVPGRTGWSVPIGDRTAFLTALVPLFSASAAERAARAAEALAYARTTFDPVRQVVAYLELFTRLTSRAP
jgi:glycosyltransferase involved in cell wall biosynthesis